MPEITSRLSTALADRYKIESHLGEGGMANVYLAHDLKHDRKVAVKVLKPELAAILGAERFLSEIKVTANLQHPHILPLFDSGEADSFLYYVMPYVEGESLREKLNREKQLGVEETVKIAEGVAAALDYAHRQGVIHRDIKPENILVHDGQPVVADFGIALAVTTAGGTRLTETGLSLGTPEYMSPEQATGEREITARSDVYSLGAAVYEMLVGDPPHTGSTVQAIIAKVVSAEPQPISDVRRTVPVNVQAAVQKALAKVPADRFGTAKEFAEALTNPGFRYGETVGAGVPVGGAVLWKRLSTGLGALASILAVGLALALFGPAQPRPVATFPFALSAGQELSSAPGVNFAVSPDGSRLVYRGPSQLLQRRIDELAIQPIPGTEGARHPVFSPSGDSVAFTTGGSLQTVSLLGGSPLTIVASGVPNSNAAGIDWGSDGMLYFTNDAGAIQRVPSTGGQPEQVTTPEPPKRHRWVDALPEGRGLLFTITWPSQRADLSEIAVLGFEEGVIRPLGLGTMARYTTSGHLVYAAADGTLWGRPFDLERLEVTGQAVQLRESVDVYLRSESQFAVSATGTLVYVPGSETSRYAGAGFVNLEPVWVERDGTAREIDPGWRVSGTALLSALALSPDDDRLAFSIPDSDSVHIWVKQLDRGGQASRVTFGADAIRPSWSSDGRWLTYSSDRAGPHFDLWRKRPDGSGEPELVWDGEGEWEIYGSLYSSDGAWLVFNANTGSSGDIFGVRLGMDGEAVPVVATGFGEDSPTLSPDGHWLAYVSRLSGRQEVYVSPFPEGRAARVVLVSTDGGDEPTWARSGRELFYVNRANELVAVQFTADSTFTPGQETVLFSLDGYLRGAQFQQYDVSSDDQFVMLRIVDDEDDDAGPELFWVQNFFEELKERVGN